MKNKKQLKEKITKDYAKLTDVQVERLQKQIQSLEIDWDYNDMQQNYDDDDSPRFEFNIERLTSKIALEAAIFEIIIFGQIV